MGGVMIKTMGKGGGETGREKRRAPRIKSSWSAMGRVDPGGRSSLRLKKDPTRSPANAPIESANPSNTLY